MTRRSCRVAAFALDLIVAVAHAAAKPEKAESRQFDISVTQQSENIRCTVRQARGSAILEIVPPTDISRVMLFRQPAAKRVMSTRRDDGYYVRKGIQRVIRVDPRTNIVYEPDAQTLEYHPVPFYKGDGSYHVLLSDSFADDWELEAPQAWCKLTLRLRR